MLAIRRSIRHPSILRHRCVKYLSVKTFPRSADKFAWMQEPGSQRARDWMRDENVFAEKFMSSKGIRVLQDRVMRDMESQWNPNTSNASDQAELGEVRKVGYVSYNYFTRDGVHYRTIVLGDHKVSVPELVMDPSMSGGAYGVGSEKVPEVSHMHMSPNHSKVAWLVKWNEGDESGQVVVRDLNTHEMFILKEIGSDIVNFVWASDRHMIYSCADKYVRPWQAWLVDITKDKFNRCIYQEDDDRFFVDVGQTKDRRFVTINSNSRTSSEVHVVDTLSVRNGSPVVAKLIRPREEGIEYYVDSTSSLGLVSVTNALDKDHYQLCVVADNPKEWKSIVKLPLGLNLEDCDIFDKDVLLYTRMDGHFAVFHLPLPERYSETLPSSAMLEIPLPSAFGTVTPGVNRDIKADKARIIWSGLGIMESVLEYSFVEKSVRRIRHVPTPTRVNFQADSVKIELIHVPLLTEADVYNKISKVQKSSAGDVPISVVYNKHQKLPFIPSPDDGDDKFTDTDNQTVPIYLTTYGCYGMSTDPVMQPLHYYLLNRGFVIAFAHVRGGSEYGRTHYMDGCGANKWKTIRDTYSVFRFLRGDYSDSKMKGIVYGSGISAGGLVLGNMLSAGLKGSPLTLPQVLFGPNVSVPDKIHPRSRYTAWNNSTESVASGLILQVPFLNSSAAMNDPELPLTTLEHEEWIGANGSESSSLLLDAYENIPETSNSDKFKMPWILMTAGGKDQRVPSWHPLKFSARLRSDIPTVYSVKYQTSLKVIGQFFGVKNTDSQRSPLILLTDEESGHFNESAADQTSALIIAFLLKAYAAQRKVST